MSLMCNCKHIISRVTEHITNSIITFIFHADPVVLLFSHTGSELKQGLLVFINKKKKKKIENTTPVQRGKH